MAGDISMITGLAVEALPSPVGTSAPRSGSQRTSARVQSAAVSGTQAQPAISGTEAAADSYANDKKLLASHLERAQKAMMAHNATFSFERDSENGRMYLHVKDKVTGEEILRIPKNYLRNVAPRPSQPHEVDVHI